jgi:hypothetical protein
VAVRESPAVARDVLNDGQDAAGQKPLGGRPAENRDRLRVAGVGAVADDVVGALDGHVEDRHRIDRDAKLEQIVRDEPHAEPREFPPDERVIGVDAPIGLARGIFGPMGRPRRCTRPPSWSMRMGASARPTVSRMAAQSARTCSGVSMFRRKRMKPQGAASLKKATSSAVRLVPDEPAIKARVMPAPYVSHPEGSRKLGRLA